MAVIEEKKESVSPEEVLEKKAPKKASAKGGKKEVVVAAEHADIAYKVLVEPWITEKTHAAMAINKYAFRVVRTATKQQVTKAIEGLYKVKVEKIAMVNIQAKKKAYGRYMGKKAAIRKAIVTLKEGDKIELFQGA